MGGYDVIFQKLLADADLRLASDFFAIRDQIPETVKIIFTGSIDAFFNYKYGRLEYRSLRFERELHHLDEYQGTSVVNYPELQYRWTRVCEPKYFHPEESDRHKPGLTIIFREYSLEDNGTDPFYPINNARNQNLYARYQKEAARLENVFLGVGWANTNIMTWRAAFYPRCGLRTAWKQGICECKLLTKVPDNPLKHSCEDIFPN